MSGGVWQSSLFGCYSDVELSIVTYVAPCYTAGKNAEATGESFIHHTIFAFLPLVSVYCHAITRGKIRQMRNIEGDFFRDIVLACCFSRCSLVQEAQELKAPTALDMGRGSDSEFGIKF